DAAYYYEPLTLKSRQLTYVSNQTYIVPDDAPFGSYDLEIMIRDENNEPVSAVIKDFLRVTD
ncbi:MAG: hypothetical protein IKX77_01030, partial [Clostridia bacterium]|nr:hypothetical protein [Clostridia bacterium]